MTTVPFSEAKTHLAELLADAKTHGDEVVITRFGRPVGVLLSLTDYEGLIETIEVLSDQDLPMSIERGLAEAEAGNLVTHEDVRYDARVQK